MNQRRSIAVCLLLLAGCSEGTPPPAPAAPPPTTGRDETAAIRNTEAIGVDGAAIGAKVDSALDANDARKAELDKALEDQ